VHILVCGFTAMKAGVDTRTFLAVNDDQSACEANAVRRFKSLIGGRKPIEEI
jgi:hypothetical protein